MKKIPKERGPYSHSYRAGDTVFVAGQLPIDPKTEEFAHGGIEELTNQVIDNIEAVLAQEGMSLSHVVKCEVFLKDMADGPGMNKAYEKRFSPCGKLPARATIQAAKLPLDARVEISCVAYHRKG
jgi:2-iminobutanoate/2-iminopropanoate deaminase